MGIGERLKEERERLGYSQTDFAAQAGASKNSQYNYEKGDRSPDAEYLAAVSKAGVDVLYVVTGRRLPSDLEGLSSAELDLLRYFKGMSPDDQVSFLRVAKGMFLVTQSTAD
ncbi:XRE family transcriptional regulator [Pseudomonas citronellolis]|uniref:helix-turn-helix domain-containing protein n=1 Tax=Pseudomonas citronellolis TaxID=53408 RepID=UPI0027A40981|nr:XRE family transcriptional regulator [Pseudomonas citronellolis]